MRNETLLESDCFSALRLSVALVAFWGSSTRQQPGQHADPFLIGCLGRPLPPLSRGRTRLSPSPAPHRGPHCCLALPPHRTPPSSATAIEMAGLPGYLWLLLPLLGDRLVAAEDVISQVTFVQRSLTSEKGPGEDSYNINADELFHVDLERKDIVWRLPRFRDLSAYSAEGILQDIAVLRSNLNILMRRSNNTPIENVPPQVTLYPEKPVELGEPNVLVCLADGFLPPVINLTWVKNGQEVKDTEETDFYPNADHSFRKFSYLTFVPNAEDIYYCRVEHWSLAQPLTKEWNHDMTETLPEMAESVVCGLGLAMGIVGIIVGTVLFIKGRRNNEANVRRRPM